RRRLRKLHVGLFGYSRATAGLTLPRAIPFCASLYSLGVPPELLGLAVVDDDDDWAWLCQTVPAIADELAEAARYLDPDARASLPPLVRESVDRASALVEAEADQEHGEIAKAARLAAESGGSQMTELIVRAAALRHFLG